MKTLRLGLIGGNITESRSPALHIACGLAVGRNVSYDLLVPAEQGLALPELLARCESLGFDGVNITYPHKEEVLKFASAGTPLVAALGAANTVRFAPSGPLAYNTDHTGFVSAFRARWGEAAPGRVLLIGAGGVGRALAFALADLGATEILLHDADDAKSAALHDTIQSHTTMTAASIGMAELGGISSIDGVLNATPLGMTGRAGSPLPENMRASMRWAFDAVYTPEHTLFRTQTIAIGADFLSGYELYFHQGVHAFQIFSATEVTRLDWVRAVLNGEKTIT